MNGRKYRGGFAVQFLERSVTLQIDQAVYSSAAEKNCEWEGARGEDLLYNF